MADNHRGGGEGRRPEDYDVDLVQLRHDLAASLDGQKELTTEMRLLKKCITEFQDIFKTRYVPLLERELLWTEWKIKFRNEMLSVVGKSVVVTAIVALAAILWQAFKASVHMP